MPDNPQDLNRLEDSLVHDEEEEPIPTGWALYATQKFLAKAVLLAYGILLVTILGTQLGFSGRRILILFMPASALIALPLALAAFYLDFVTPPERPEITRKRTSLGRLLAVFFVYIMVGIITIILSVGLSRAFTLR